MRVALISSSKSMTAVWYDGGSSVWRRERWESMRSKRVTGVSSGRVGWPASVMACHMLRTWMARAGLLKRAKMRSHSWDAVRPRESVSREGRLRSDWRTANGRQVARAEARTEKASKTRVNSEQARERDSSGPPLNWHSGV